MDAAEARAKRDLSDGFCFWLAAGVHLLASAFHKYGLGVSIANSHKDFGDLETFVHHLPVALRETELLTSLWHMHSQPPLFNLYTGAVVKLLPEAWWLDGVQWFHMLLGALACGFLYLFLDRSTKSRRFALGGALALGLDPTLPVYEAFAMYTVPAAFLNIAACACLAAACSREEGKSRLGPALWAVAALNALVLLRSVYHAAIILPIGLGLAAFAARERWRRALGVGLLICLTSFGWYTKNYFMHGFWGGSSWLGLSLWKQIVRAPGVLEDVPRLVEAGVVDPVTAASAEHVARSGLRLPLEAYREMGIDRTYGLAALDGPNQHNINVLEISRLHEASAKGVILRHPAAFLRQGWESYHIFAAPSLRYPLVAGNVSPRLGFVGPLWCDGLHGQLPLRQFASAWPFSAIFYPAYLTWLFFLIPAGPLLHAASAFRAFGRSLAKWRAYLSRDAAMVLAPILTLYTASVTSLLEVRENERMKVMVEHLFYAYLLVLAWRFVAARRAGGRAGWATGEGGDASED